MSRFPFRRESGLVELLKYLFSKVSTSVINLRVFTYIQHLNNPQTCGKLIYIKLKPNVLLKLLLLQKTNKPVLAAILHNITKYSILSTTTSRKMSGIL